MSARMISDPLCLLDCDVSIDGSAALVISSRETVSDLRAPVAIDAIATASRGRLLCEQWEDLSTMASFDAASQLWSRSRFRASDVDFAQLYDGFSIMTLMWIEALGLCGRGEAGEFVNGGSRIGPGGELPINTWGGQLSGGRLHGFGSPIEAVHQIRGEAGARQVSGAEIGVVGVGAGHLAGAMLLCPL
jgi:acetyl-CoA acetyltransferase